MAKKRAEKDKALIFGIADEESSAQPVVTRKRKDFTKPDPKSGKLRPYGGTGEGNPSHAAIPQEDRCTAKRAKDGEPCTKLRVTGATVCGTHGGRAPQVMRKAMARLQNSADRLVQGLLDIATDEDEPTAVRLAALRDALDRAGIKATEKVDIAHSMKPWEQVLTRVTRVSEEPTDPAIIELRETDDRY